MSDSEALCNQT
ncbi:hypothetical protein R3I93_021765 [Phoxinus phoxinus]|uniref:Uncharacterized protein n=1 Tax=Phoxinus phoxinus TaxID=58324 RepID=A0AAN9C6D4_9TELE